MKQATLLFCGDLLLGKRDADSGEKDEIIAQRKAGALTRAFAHVLAKAAIECAIAFVFPHAQFLRIDTDIAKHTRTSIKAIIPYILTDIFQKSKSVLRLLRKNGKMFLLRSFCL